MIIASSFFFIYIITILVFAYGFDRINVFKPKNLKPKTRFSIIVPFRNEAENLPKLLASIHQLNYPKTLFEFIFVDDDSTDNSLSIIERFFANTQNDSWVLKNIRTSNSPKKDAITIALNASHNEWVITTDADCVLSNNWLKTLDNYIQQNDCNMLVAPVTYQANNSLLHQFQLLDFLSLQASTISGFGLQQPFLCNGANLSYRKSIFEKVDGFKNNNTIASGDDIFLLEKFLKFEKSKVNYVKSTEAIVKTFPVNTFNDLLNQRVRWTSKTASYNLFFGKMIGVIILLGNSFIAVVPFLLIFSGVSISIAVKSLFMKFFVDYLLIKRASNLHSQNLIFSSYLISSVCYPYFTILVFLKSIFSNYNWKGRTFKR
jgi:cellulose synthase/poly-beta-1,6-N-acetylglucosamine synthase-like glycosyltransferase